MQRTLWLSININRIKMQTWRPRMSGRKKSLLNEEHLLRCYNVRKSKAYRSSIFYSVLSRYVNLRNSLGIFSFLRPSVSLNELYLNEWRLKKKKKMVSGKDYLGNWLLPPLFLEQCLCSNGQSEDIIGSSSCLGWEIPEDKDYALLVLVIPGSNHRVS